jgi:hypothetical protein
VTAALYDQLLYTSEINLNNFSTGYALLAFNGAVSALGDLANRNALERGVGASYPPALQGQPSSRGRPPLARCRLS